MWSRKSTQVTPTEEDVTLAEVRFWRLRLIRELNLREWPDAVELKIDTGRHGLRKFVKTRAHILTEVERMDDAWHPICDYALSDEDVICELDPLGPRKTWLGKIQPASNLWEHEVAQDARHIIRMIQATIKQVQALPVPA